VFHRIRPVGALPAAEYLRLVRRLPYYGGAFAGALQRLEQPDEPEPAITPQAVHTPSTDVDSTPVSEVARMRAESRRRLFPKHTEFSTVSDTELFDQLRKEKVMAGG